VRNVVVVVIILITIRPSANPTSMEIVAVIILITIIITITISPDTMKTVDLMVRVRDDLTGARSLSQSLSEWEDDCGATCSEGSLALLNMHCSLSRALGGLEERERTSERVWVVILPQGGVHFNTTDGRLRAWRGAPRRGLGDLDRLGQTISHCMHEMNGNERK